MKSERNINLLFCIFFINLFMNINFNINKPMITNIKVSEINSAMPTLNNYYAILEIPTIKLKEKLVSIDNKDNNVNKSIEILFPSTMPDKSKSILILAAHSGNSKVSYFKDLEKLIIKDFAYIYYKNNVYKYRVINIERQNKNGHITIPKNKNKSILILTTCDQRDKSKQIVITLKLI